MVLPIIPVNHLIESKPMQNRIRWVVPGFVLAGSVVAVAGNALGELGGVARGVVGVAALVALGVGLRRHRPPAAWAWVMIGVGVGFQVLGDAVWDWISYQSTSNPTTIHAADVMYLSGYPFLIAGVGGLAAARSPRRDRDGFIDGGLLALAAVILVWAFLVAPNAQTGDMSTADRIILAAYPLADGMLLAAVAWLAFSPARRTASLWYLGAALGLTFVLDVTFDVLTRLGTSQRTLDVMNPLWTISYVLFAAAVLHPSVVDLTARGERTDRRVHPARLVFLGAALFAGPLVTVFTLDDPLIAICSLAVAGLVVVRFVSVLHDNERARTEAARSERRFRVLAEESPVGIYEVSQDLRIAFANEESARLFGRPVKGSTAQDLLEMVDPDDRRRTIDAAETVIGGQRASVEFRLHGADGATRWVSWHGTPIPGPGEHFAGGFASTLDITPIKQAEEVLAHQATRDALTGLANRRQLFERLDMAIARLARSPGRITVLFIDLDRFKEINDTFGHGVGDTLLVVVAHRIGASVRLTDVAARIGGDEFVLVLEGAGSTRDDLALAASRLIASIEEPVIWEDSVLMVSASVGIAFTDDPAGSADELVSQADSAMYRAKAAGRGRYAFHDSQGWVRARETDDWADED